MLRFEDVLAARERIRGSVVRTPFLRSEPLSRLTGAELYVKYDHLQAIGAFKERGAANRIALLTPQERGRGVVAM
jgi:threonine dehydratase